jgi:hypothetical protein
MHIPTYCTTLNLRRKTVIEMWVIGYFDIVSNETVQN